MMVEMADCIVSGQIGEKLPGSHRSPERGQRGESRSPGLGLMGNHRSLVTPGLERADCS